MDFYKKQLEQDKLDNVSFAMFFNELAKIERESILAFGSTTKLGSSNSETSIFQQMMILKINKLTTSIGTFSNHHILIILAGFGNIFSHRESLRYIDQDFVKVMMSIAEHFD